MGFRAQVDGLASDRKSYASFIGGTRYKGKI